MKKVELRELTVKEMTSIDGGAFLGFLIAVAACIAGMLCGAYLGEKIK